MNSKVLPLLALILSILVFFAYIRPLWTGDIARTKAAIESDDAALAAAKAYADRQRELAAARSAMSPADLARLSMLLPDSVDNVRLILDLNALASKSGLSLSDVDMANSNSDAKKSEPQGGAPTSGGAAQNAQAKAPVLGSADLTVSAIGTYASLQSFMRGVEKSGRLLDVRQLSVKGSNSGAYNYQMTIRLYWLR